MSVLSRDGPSRRASQSPVIMMRFLISSSTTCVSRWVDDSLPETGDSGGSLEVDPPELNAPETGRVGG